MPIRFAEAVWARVQYSHPFRIEVFRYASSLYLGSTSLAHDRRVKRQEVLERRRAMGHHGEDVRRAPETLRQVVIDRLRGVRGLLFRDRVDDGHERLLSSVDCPRRPGVDRQASRSRPEEAVADQAPEAALRAARITTVKDPMSMAMRIAEPIQSRVCSRFSSIVEPSTGAR